MSVLDKFHKQFTFLNTLATVVASVTIIAGGYAFYRTSIWKPTLKVNDVDWVKGVATIQEGKSNMLTLYRNQVLSVGGSFGVRFASDTNDSLPTRIELYKEGMTYKILAQKS